MNSSVNTVETRIPTGKKVISATDIYKNKIIAEDVKVYVHM